MPVKTIRVWLATLVVCLATACSLSASVATDSTPASLDDARQLAQSVASKAHCGSFEDLGTGPAAATWVFTCQRSGSSFEVTVWGSQTAKSAGIAALDARHATYFSKNMYAVTVVSSQNGATDSALTPFKK
ncbi:MAG: hypothetical protein ACREOY_03750 [Candidatus Dormibacteraceae bacterium]